MRNAKPEKGYRGAGTVVKTIQPNQEGKTPFYFLRIMDK